MGTTIGQFATAKLVEEQRRVAASRNAGGDVGMLPNVARAVVKEYPNATREEKAAVFGSLKGEAELTKMRTGKDTSAGLAEAARILGT